MNKVLMIHDALVALLTLLEAAGIKPQAVSVMTEDETYVLLGGDNASK